MTRARNQVVSEKQNAIAARLEEDLQKVESLDEDRILRHFINAAQSAIRTNFYQTDKDGQPKPLISVKFESRKITDLPLPRPLYEIFVYSPRVEGVHCASARSRAAASAGRTGRKISAPRSSGW